MPNLPIMDMHVHLFPSVEWDYRLYMAGREKVSGLVPPFLAYMKANGVVRGNMLMYIPTRIVEEEGLRQLPATLQGAAREEEAKKYAIRRAVEFNEWGLKTCKEHPELSCMIWVDVVRMGKEAALKELDDKIRRGATGVKFVPHGVPIRLDDRRLWPIFDYCQSHGVPCLTQAGARGPQVNGTDEWGNPRFAADALKAFPRLKMCFAHMGSTAGDALMELAKNHKNVFADLSTRFTNTPPEECAKLIRQVGAERVMFGTNFGSNTIESDRKQVEVLLSLAVTEREREDMASKTWDRFVSKN